MPVRWMTVYLSPTIRIDRARHGRPAIQEGGLLEEGLTIEALKARLHLFPGGCRKD
jgi:hypothetical protein